MVELHDVYSFLYAAAAALSLMVSVAAWQRRRARGAIWLGVLMLGVAVWAGTSAAMWQATSETSQVIWFRANALGVWVVPVAVLMIAFDVAGMQRWLTPARILPIAAISFVLDNVEWLNPARLYDANFVPETIGGFTYYTEVPGPLYWTFSVFAFGAMGVGLVILFRHYLRSSGIERTQSALLVSGGLLPFVSGLVSEADVVPYPFHGLELAPLAFLVTGSVWLSAIARGVLLDVLPVARETVIKLMPDGVIVLDAEQRVVEANPAASRILLAHDLVGRPVGDALTRIDGAAEVLDDATEPQRTVLQINRDGEGGYVEVSVTPLADGSDQPPARLITLHDVTEERRTLERLGLAQTVFDAADEGIVVLEHDFGTKIVEINDACCRMLRRSREQMLGSDCREFASNRYPAEFCEDMRRTILAEGAWEGEVWQTRGDGTEFPSRMTFSVANDEAGRRSRIVGFLADVSEAKEAERLRHDATHDPLTGLANRAVLDDRLSHAIAHAKRVGRGLAVLFADLDNFKRVNDTLGHSRGDALLAEAGRRIVAVLRGGDTAARPGGDEFVIIADAKNPAEIEAEARRLREALAEPYRLESESLYVTASVGIALYPADGTDVAALVRHADLAMYGAKRLGRNRIQFFSPELQKGLDRRVAVEKELVGGLEDGRCFLAYQPQVDLHTGKIVGAEALVNLRSRDGTVLSPAEFMPAAEYSEIIIALGEWTLRETCTQLARFREVAPDLIVSLCLSARQLRELDAAQLHVLMNECGAQPRRLALGVTQTAFLGDPNEVAAKLEKLRDEVGTRLLFDDFGSGHCSPAFTALLPAGVVKIDRSVVQRLPDDAEARAMVLSTIALAKSLGATIVADGPETEGQINLLRANECDAAQGYYFGYPMSLDELLLQLGSETVHAPRA